MRKKIWFWLIAFMTVLVISCNNEVQKSNLSTIKVGYIPIADCSQLYVGIEQGFFEAENIKIELKSMAGGSKILQTLGAGSIDVGFSNVVSLILAREAGLPFVAFTGGPAQDENHKEHALLVKKDSPIKDIKELSGKKIALNTRKNIDELMVTLLLKKYNVDLSTVRFIEVPFPRMLGVLEGGDVDAIAAIEPFVTFGLSDQKNRVLSYNYLEIQPVTEIAAYLTTENWINNNPEMANKFQRALEKSSQFIAENDEQVRQIMTKYTGLDENQTKDITLPFFTKKISEERLNDMIEKVYRMGWIKEPFSASELIN